MIQMVRLASTMLSGRLLVLRPLQKCLAWLVTSERGHEAAVPGRRTAQ